MTDSTQTTDVSPRRLGHLPGLDGLRGAAVLLVLLYHLEIEGFEGGFLGVDVFFVLSGFLITSLLIGEFHERSRVDLVGFWLRRARRLLPAVFVMITAVVAIGPTIDATLRNRLRWDAIASIFYVVNWRYVITGQSYAAESTDPSMLGHLWSLAIEEQFYVVWPLVVLGGGLALRNFGSRGRSIALVVIHAAIVASAAALWLAFDRFDPSAAYFSTHTRVFEPLAGAALAIAMSPRQFVGHREERAHRVDDLVFIAAVVVMVWAVASLTFTQERYYRGGAIAVTIATVTLIAAITRGSTIGKAAVGGRVLGACGRVSYGLYLWHWPIIVWLDEDRTGWSGFPLFAARVATIALTTVVSYRYVEQPIRSGRIGNHTLDARFVFPRVAVALVVVSALAAAGTVGAKPLPEYLDEGDSGVIDVDQPAEITIALIGDSVARSLAPGMQDEVLARGHGYAQATFGGCSVGQLLRTKEDGTPFASAQRCTEWTAEAFSKLVVTSEPDIVVWYSQRERYGVEVDGTNLEAGTVEWRNAVFADWDGTLARLTSGGARVALVLPVYADGVDTVKCEGDDAIALASDTTCARDNALSGGPLRAFYREWAATHPDEVVVIDLLESICGVESRCDSMIDGTPLRPDDGIHFSEEGAALVAPILLDRIISN
jgi:peptidoglycan/LPS O-acetylase OafA/YrhL